MTRIPKQVTSTSVAKGMLIRLSPMSKLWDKKYRVGVLLNVNGTEEWFNDYGTEEALNKKYDPFGVNEQLTISYVERSYTDKAGNKRVARDIKSIAGEQKKLMNKDISTFAPLSEINVEKLLKDLKRISSIVNSWRGVLVGKEDN